MYDDDEKMIVSERPVLILNSEADWSSICWLRLLRSHWLRGHLLTGLLRIRRGLLLHELLHLHWRSSPRTGLFFGLPSFVCPDQCSCGVGDCCMDRPGLPIDLSFDDEPG